jgi:mono/diheme cytochrome c family protein
MRPPEERCLQPRVPSPRGGAVRPALWVWLALVIACATEGEGAPLVTDAGVACDPTVPPATQDPVERGRYLVHHVAACVQCHTPRTGQRQELDEARMLAGVLNVLDLAPEDDTVGAIHAPNLTPDPETGLGEWSDEEIRAAFLDGVSRDGSALHPFMPYPVFHNMRAEDADAIVAYLRSLPPIANAIPDRQPLPTTLDAPAAPIAVETLPASQLEPGDPALVCAERGAYLTTRVGACIMCHTREVDPGTGVLDATAYLLGNRPFPPFHFGEPPPEELAGVVIYSRNLTPHEHGIAGWTPEDVRRALQLGLNSIGLELFPPMASGPDGPFGGMRDQDALDIGFYLTNLEPRDSGEIPLSCGACHGDGSRAS